MSGFNVGTVGTPDLVVVVATVDGTVGTVVAGVGWFGTIKFK